MDTNHNKISYYNLAYKIIVRMLLIVFFIFSAFFIFILLDEYRVTSKINKNDKLKFGQIDAYLYEFYSLCKIYPTTEQNLLLLAEDMWCGQKGNKLNKDLLKMEESKLIYISDGKKYKLILYKNMYGVERNN